MRYWIVYSNFKFVNYTCKCEITSVKISIKWDVKFWEFILALYVGGQEDVTQSMLGPMLQNHSFKVHWKAAYCQVFTAKPDIYE